MPLLQCVDSILATTLECCSQESRSYQRERGSSSHERRASGKLPTPRYLHHRHGMQRLPIAVGGGEFSHRRSFRRGGAAQGSPLQTSQHPECRALPGRQAQSVRPASWAQARARARSPRAVARCGSATARPPPVQCCREHLWQPKRLRAARRRWMRRSPSQPQPATTAASSPPSSSPHAPRAPRGGKLGRVQHRARAAAGGPARTAWPHEACTVASASSGPSPAGRRRDEVEPLTVER